VPSESRKRRRDVSSAGPGGSWSGAMVPRDTRPAPAVRKTAAAKSAAAAVPKEARFLPPAGRPLDPGAVTFAHGENSEVLPAGSVAVAVTNWPGSTPTA